MFFTRKSIANVLNVPSKCSGCGVMVMGKEFCQQCGSFYEMGVEKMYLELFPDERSHVHEVGYTDRLNSWVAEERARGAMPTAAQIIAAEQDIIVDVLKSGRRKKRG